MKLLFECCRQVKGNFGPVIAKTVRGCTAPKTESVVYYCKQTKILTKVWLVRMLRDVKFSAFRMLIPPAGSLNTNSLPRK